MAFNENISREIFFNRVMEMINETHRYVYRDQTHYKEEVRENPDKRPEYGDIIDVKETPRNTPRITTSDQRLLMQHIHDLAQAQTVLDTGYEFKLNRFPMQQLNFHNMRSRVYSEDIAALYGNNIENLGAVQGNVTREVTLSKMQDRVNASLKGIKDIHEKYKLPNVIANVKHMAENISKDPTNWIRYDLYNKPEDIGIFSKRVLGSDFFEEDEFAKVNEVLHQYTSSSSVDPQSRHIGLHDRERQFFEETGIFQDIEKAGVDPEQSPYEGREYVLKKKAEHDKTLAEMKSDRQYMRQIDGILQEVEENKKWNLARDLKPGDEKYRPQTIMEVIEQAKYMITRRDVADVDLFDENGMARSGLLKFMDKEDMDKNSWSRPSKESKLAKARREKNRTHPTVQAWEKALNMEFSGTAIQDLVSTDEGIKLVAYLEEKMKKKKSNRDEDAMRYMQYFMEDSLNFPVNRAGIEYDNIYKFRSHVYQSLQDTYNLDRPQVSRYKEAAEFNESYRLMTQELFYRQRELNQALHGYLDENINRSRSDGDVVQTKRTQGVDLHNKLVQENKDKSPEDKRGFNEEEKKIMQKEIEDDLKVFTEQKKIRTKGSGRLEDDEAKNLSQYQRRLLEIQDANEYAYEKMSKAIQDNPDNLRPLSPLNQIRRTLLESMTDIDPEVTDQKTHDLIKWLDGGEEPKDIIITDHMRSYLHDLSPEERDSLKYQIVNQVDDTQNVGDRKRWLDFISNQQRVYVSGSQVAYVPKSMKGDIIKLEAEHIEASQLRFKSDRTMVDVQKEIGNALENMQEVQEKSKLSQAEMRETTKQKLHNNFIEVAYTNNRNNERLRQSNEKAFEKIQELEDFFKPLAEDYGEKTSGDKFARVNTKNLLEQYESYMRTISGKDRVVMPAYLDNMVRTHASWMMMGNQDDLANSAFLALGRAFEDMQESGDTVDLRAEGFQKMWRSQGKTDKEIEALTEGLKDKNLKELLDDFMFQRVLGKLHQEWFESTDDFDKNKSLDLLLENARSEIARANFEGNESNITGETVHSHLRKNGREIRKQPMYSPALKLTPKEINERLRAIDKGESKHITFSADASDWNLDVSDDTRDPEGVSGRRGTIRDLPVDGYGSFEDKLIHHLDEGKEQLVLNLEGVEDLSDEDKKKFYKSLGDGKFNFRNKEGVDAFLSYYVDGAGEEGIYTEYTNNEGKVLNAFVTKGEQGDLLAHLVDEGRTVQIVDNSSEASSRQKVGELSPKIFHGGTRTEDDIVKSAGLLREPVVNYESLQRRGRGVIQADPNDTFAVAKEFLDGKTTLTYLDLETTGVSNSMLPKQVLKPLEVFARQADWNPETNDFYYDQGEVATKNGKSTYHAFLQPSDRMEDYLYNIVDNEDFMINQEFSLFDYNENKAKYDDMIALRPDALRINKEVQRKQARLWYLQNFAKYGVIDENQDRYKYYTGAEPVPKEASERYIQALKEDAEKGLGNLSRTGIQGAGRYEFSPDQIGLSNGSTLAGQIQSFSKGTALAGQNFAEADWQKIVGLHEDKVHDIKKDLSSMKRSLIDELTSHENTKLDEIAEKINRIAPAEYVQLVDGESLKDTKYKTQVDPNAHRYELERDERGDLKISKNGKVKEVRVPTPKMGIDDNHTNKSNRIEIPIDPSEQIAQMREENPKITSDEIKDRLNEQGIVQKGGTYTPEQARVFAEETVGKFQSGGGKDRTSSRTSFGDAYTGESMGKVRGVIDTLKEKGFGGLNQVQRDLITDLQEDGKITFNYRDVGKKADELKDTEEYVKKVKKNKPRILEQQFLSKAVFPDEKSHKAESTYKNLGMKVDDGKMHLATTDVDQGLEGIKRMLHILNNPEAHPEFTDWTPEQIKKGDVVEMHNQVRPDVPTGVYEVMGISNDRPEVELKDRVSGESFKMSAPSQGELERKWYRNFDYVGAGEDPEIEERVKERLDDYTRRQIDAANHEPFMFNLHQQQSRDFINNQEGLMQKGLDKVHATWLDLKNSGRQAETTLEHVAASNGKLFESADYIDWLNKKNTPLQNASYKDAGLYYQDDKGEGGKRQAFLEEVRGMEEAKAINNDTAREMIRNYNMQIKEAGKSHGYTRVNKHKKVLGLMDETFGHREGRPMVIDTRNQRTITNSLWDHAQKYQSMYSGDSETEQRGKALNQKILPFLQKQGLIQSDDNGRLNVQSAVKQLMDKELNPFVEYDFLKFNESGQNEIFMNEIDQIGNSILDPHRETLTPAQRERIAKRQEMIQELGDNYHPALRIEPTLQSSQTDTVNFKSFDNLTDIDPRVRRQIVDDLVAKNPDKAAYTRLREDIFAGIFKEATAGKPGSLEGLLGEGVGPRQLQAMEALNWIQKVDDDYKEVPIEERYLGARIGTRNHGSRFSATKVNELPLDLMNDIVGGNVRGYTRDEHANAMLDVVKTWKDDDGVMSPQAPDTTSYRKEVNYNNLTDEQLADMSSISRKQIRQLNEQIKQEGSIKKNSRYNNNKYMVEETMEDTIKHQRQPGAIEQGIQRGKQTIQEGWDNFATSLQDSGASKAALWVAGIGLAGYALNQFMDAGDPLKISKRPQGHGVGFAGHEEDDKGSTPHTNVNLSNKSYEGVTSEGYNIRAKAKGDNIQEFNEAAQKMKEGMGDVKINVNDSRENYDRNWLENQFSSFLDRGHI